MPQSQPRPHNGLNDMQISQRQVMLKKLLELRRHNQLQELGPLGDGRQQIYLSQLSATNKQAEGQFSSLPNGTLSDASQLCMFDSFNFGCSDKSQSLQDQSQGLHFRNQEPEVSSDGTPIDRSRSNLNMYSAFQGLSHDSANIVVENNNKGTNPSAMQSSHLSNTCLGESNNVSSNHVYMADGGSFSSGGQELTSWLTGYAGTTMQSNPSPGSSTLDPLEQKFLFGVDDNNCSASSGRDADMVTGSGKISESAEYLSSFPSIQGGSWSALMQSAVAEGPLGFSLQQEWNGQISHKAELSTDIHPANPLDSGHEQAVWLGNNVQGHSSSDGKSHLPDDSKLSSSFPGFQNLNQNIGKRQTAQPFENARSNGPGQVLDHSEHIAPPQSIFAYNTQQSRSLEGFSRPGNYLQNSHLSAPKTPPSTLIGTESNHPNIDLSSFNPFGQQFPTLESMPLSQQPPISGLYQQNGSSVNPKESGECLINSEDIDCAGEHTGKGSLHHSGKEAVGQSLNPSSRHPNHSLLYQVHSNNSKATNSSPGALAENVGKCSGFNVQQVSAVTGYQMTNGHDAGARQTTYFGSNVPTQFSKFPSSNVKMLNFSANGGEGRSVKTSTLSPVQESSPKIAADCSRISSISKNFGSLKNGQMLSMFDSYAQQNALVKPYNDLPRNASINQVNAAFSSQVNVWPATGTTLSPSDLSPHCGVTPDVGNRAVPITKSKKRKISMYEFLPWHKEITQGPKRLQTIRMAEVSWSRAANRLTEKVGAVTDTIEDVSLLRPRKRLLLSTQLLQQLFSPAPAYILSADAISSCGSVTYFSAKLALRDACNLICLRSDSFQFSNCNNQSPENSKTSESSMEQYFSKVAEDLASRAKKLEDDFMRLDKATSSLVDLKVDCQDLEKFAVINRFARFHFRGQRKTDEASANVRKPIPQRYVAAYPMPGAVPERAPCMAL